MVLLEGNRRPPAKSRHAPFSTVSPAPALLRLTVLGRHRSADAASISSFLLPNTPTSLHHRKMPPRPSEDCHFKHRVAPSIERQRHPLDGVTVLRQRRDVQRYQQKGGARASCACISLATTPFSPSSGTRERYNASRASAANGDSSVGTCRPSGWSPGG